MFYIYIHWIYVFMSMFLFFVFCVYNLLWWFSCACTVFSVCVWHT